MQRRQFLTSAALLSTGSIGAAAYSTATVSRNVTVALDTDDTAVIGLVPSNQFDAVSLNKGRLTIDTQTGSSTGLNTNASFVYGDSTSPSTTFAFKLTNNDSVSRDFTFELTGFAGAFGGNSSLTFTFYDNTGTQAASITASGSTASTTLSSNASLYAIIDIDTSGLDHTTNPSGKLKLTAANTTAP